MNPDVALQNMREAIAKATTLLGSGPQNVGLRFEYDDNDEPFVAVAADSLGEALMDIYETADALDEWLTRWGPLPKAWQR